jgi:hypothetical protein
MGKRIRGVRVLIKDVRMRQLIIKTLCNSNVRFLIFDKKVVLNFTMPELTGASKAASVGVRMISAPRAFKTET